jgi:small subunit ribosomal protein S18
MPKRKTETERKPAVVRAKKTCAYCDEKKTPSYTDTVGLKRFTSGRGKIVGKSRSGVCSKHQRAVTREIKRARLLALLPFTLRV